MSRKKATADKGMKTTPRKEDTKPRVTKLGRLEAMLRKPEGATIDQLGKVLAWQRHSVRGAIAGSLKKKGLSVTSEQPGSGPRIYRIV